MGSSRDAQSVDDPYDLGRFVRAQEADHEQALSEIRSGRKRTHWMWYIFPQIDGLARTRLLIKRDGLLQISGPPVRFSQIKIELRTRGSVTRDGRFEFAEALI